MGPTAGAIVASPPTFAAAWVAAVSTDSGRLALIDARDGSAFTLGELDDLLWRTVTWMLERGLQTRDRMLVAAPPELETLLLLSAAQLVGVVPVLLQPDAPPVRVAEVAAVAAVRLVVDAAALADLAEALPHLSPLRVLSTPDPEAEAVILFSSGSTGPAKGVRHSHRALAVGVARVAQTAAIQPGERAGLPFLAHTITGFRLGLAPVAQDGTTTVLLSPGGSAAELLDQCAAHGVHVLHTVPSFVRACLHAPTRLGPLMPATLRRVMAGGGALSDEERRRFAVTFGRELMHSYGATEIGGTCSAALVHPDGTSDRGMGRPLVPMEIRDTQGARCGVGEEGWISVSPEAPMLGFLGGDGPVARDGRLWVETGDLGALDAEGNLHVRGRAARTYAAPSGEKVLLDDLEAVLRAALGVEAVACALQLPRRGPTLGVLVAAESASPLWEAKGRSALASTLPGVAIPAIWRALPALPTTSNGKIDLVRAREILETLA